MKKIKILFVALFSFVIFPIVTSCDVPIPPSINITNGAEVTLEVGQNYQLDIMSENLVSPISFESSVPNVASVDENGLVVALNVGQSIISASSDDVSDSIEINVIPRPATIDILTDGPIEIHMLEEAQIFFETKNNAGEVSFISSNAEIVEAINMLGDSVTIRGLKDGTTTITLSLDNGASDTIEVIVSSEPLTSLSLALSKDVVCVGGFAVLLPTADPSYYEDVLTYEIIDGNDLIEIDGTTINPLKRGTVTIQATYDDVVSNIVSLEIYDFLIEHNHYEPIMGWHRGFKIFITTFIELDYDSLQCQSEVEGMFEYSLDAFQNHYVVALALGKSSFYLYDDLGHMSNSIEVEVLLNEPEVPIPEDLYKDMSEEDFYNNYERCNTPEDDYSRYLYDYMYGDLEVPDQELTIAEYQYRKDAYLAHNDKAMYMEYELKVSNTIYNLYDCYGNKIYEIYYGGAYITVEDVASYIYAFGEAPRNYEESTTAKPSDSPWGKYLRLSGGEFEGNASYMPDLPGISSSGGNLIYYEVDIGTTGTDADPNRPNRIYNDGTRIERGGARIVYSKYYADSGAPVLPEDRYVFYTNNYYNDFQEYLNYYQGWGEKFGNITGGGTLSSNNPNACNPTPYVETTRISF